MRRRRTVRIFLTLVAIAAASAVVAGCGGGHGGGHGESTSNGNDVDRAFVRLMIPHHESAVDMAALAQDKAEHEEIRTLAASITSSQNAEINQMKGIAKSIDAKVGAHSTGGMDHGSGHSMGDPDDLETLGLDEAKAGMTMSADGLEDAKPFDRAFIDEMVPHHQGAVRMAEALLAKGRNPELKRLARDIIEAQEKEIAEMNSWRTDWYGAPVRDAG